MGGGGEGYGENGLMGRVEVENNLINEGKRVDELGKWGLGKR